MWGVQQISEFVLDPRLFPLNHPPQWVLGAEEIIASRFPKSLKLPVSKASSKLKSCCFPWPALLQTFQELCVHPVPCVQFSPVAQWCPTLCDPTHARPPCPSLTPGVHSNSRPSRRWCHPAISSSVVPFSSCPQSLPASQSCVPCVKFLLLPQIPKIVSVIPTNSYGISLNFIL